MPNKKTERFYLERLAELGIEFPPGELKPSEAPDFTIGSPEAAILGIEVAELFHDEENPSGASRQVQESMRERVLQLARVINDRSGGRPVHVAVFFDHTNLLTKSRVQPLGHAIADIVGEARVESDCHAAGLPEGVDIRHIPGRRARKQLGRPIPNSSAAWKATHGPKARTGATASDIETRKMGLRRRRSVDGQR